MKTQMLVLTTVALLLASCTKSSVENASTEFNKLPAAVQKTVHAAVPNGEVADVDEDRRDGLVAYKIKFRDSDRHRPIWVAADGRLLRDEPGEVADRDLSTANGKAGNPSEFSALPVRVQKAIEDNAPKAEVSSIRRDQKNGVVIYEIEYAGKKVNPTIQVTDDGTVIKPLSRGQASR